MSSGYGRIKGARAAILCPRHQADAVLAQANPVSGTQYTVLALNSNVRIIGIQIMVEWTVQPTPLEIHLYIDGQTITWHQDNPASVTDYLANINDIRDPTDERLGNSTSVYRAFLIEGRSVRVTAETTGGTVQNLWARIKWARW